MDTLKWTTVAVGRGLRARVHLVALEMAWGPVSDSVSTEFRYNTLHAGKRWKARNNIHSVTNCFNKCPAFVHVVSMTVYADHKQMLQLLLMLYLSMTLNNDTLGLS